MPISLLGKNKSVGFSDIAEVYILFQKKNFFFQSNFREKNQMQPPILFVLYVKFI